MPQLQPGLGIHAHDGGSLSPYRRLVVVGGGAAGFFCAVNAARMNPDLEVVLLEKSGKLLSKVRISGGGRCNVTNACADIGEMSKRYPRGGNFVKKAFYQFFTTDTIRWFEERGMMLKAEADGRMFPVSNTSQSVIDCLLNEAARFNVHVKMGVEVTGIHFQQHSFKIRLKAGEPMHADYVCIACGGYPKYSMFDWLTELGHTVEEPVPSLFTFNLQAGTPGHLITKLPGVSVEHVNVKIAGTKLGQEGPLLITHWGLSGPAILRLSAWGARDLKAGNWEFETRVNWLPAYNEQQLPEKFKSLRFEIASQKLINRNPFGLPQRLWEFLIEYSSINSEKRWADMTTADQNRLVKNICACPFSVRGKTTFKEEFVTAGGIRLNEVDVNTMMSKKIPGLYFAGETLDVDGITGGYNFQHAWTSGFVAAKHIAKRSKE